MRREDIDKQTIKELHGIPEAIEMIHLLTYPECIAVLNGTRDIPFQVHQALMQRAKEANGGKTTWELIAAGMQNIVNG